MRLKNYLPILVLFLVSCNKSNDKLIIKKNDQLTNIRYALGINGYTNINKTKNGLHFEIIGKENLINDQVLNLDKITVDILKSDSNTLISYTKNKTIYKLKLNKNGISVINNNSTSIEQNFQTTNGGEDCIPFGTCSNINPEITAMIVVLSDPILASSEFNTIEFEATPNYVIDDGGCDSYYGYTIGWGLTSTESKDHESSVRNRNSTKNHIQMYKCSYLGTDTSCGWGNSLCITTSTYKCCKN